MRWLPEGHGYTTWEDSKETPGGRDLVRYDPATGKREVLVPAAHLIPPREIAPLPVDDYALSKDRARLLIFTNSKRVWRRNTRGDYWVLDRATRELRKLGGDAPPSSLMLAKLAPVGPRVAYVRDNNLYVEDLRDGRITRADELAVARRDQRHVRLGLRGGIRPPRRLPLEPRRRVDRLLAARYRRGSASTRSSTTTDSLYPRITRSSIPRSASGTRPAGSASSPADGGETRWLTVPGDPRENYIAFMEWAGLEIELVLQQLNRLQNTRRRSMLADTGVRTARSQTHDPDRARRRLGRPPGRAALDRRRRQGVPLAQRARRLAAHLPGRPRRAATPTPDHPRRLRRDPDRRGSTRSRRRSTSPPRPTNATQKYLYRVGLDGTGRERLTPKDQPGTHDYEVSPDGRWAVHHYSTANTPPVVELVRLPGHERVKLLHR